MSLVVKGNHPLAEKIARKLFDIESAQPREARKMVNDAAKDAVEYVEQLEQENEQLRELLQEMYDWTKYKNTTWAKKTYAALQREKESNE